MKPFIPVTTVNSDDITSAPLSDSDVKALTINTFPVGITELAKPVWKEVVSQNRPLLRKFDSLVDRWVAALLLFKDECERRRVTPFRPDLNAVSTAAAYRYMEHKAKVASELFKEFLTNLESALTPDCVLSRRLPQLLGPERCPLYADLKCYQFVIPLVIKVRDASELGTFPVEACVRKAAYTLCDRATGLHKGPARDGVRTLCYVTQASPKSVSVVWVGSVFAKEFTSLRGIKLKLLNLFKSLVSS